MSSPGGLHSPPRNVWAACFTSFLNDISSEMVINILPLFLTNVLGVQTAVIRLIEGWLNQRPAWSRSFLVGSPTDFRDGSGW